MGVAKKRASLGMTPLDVIHDRVLKVRMLTMAATSAGIAATTDALAATAPQPPWEKTSETRLRSRSKAVVVNRSCGQPCT